MKIVITFGTFDLFHIGHVNILKKSKKYGDKLIVGVSSDELNYKKKSIYPVFKQEDRLRIIKSIKYVDEVFIEESLELKGEYIKQFNADILVMGEDWKGKFDEFKTICKVIYLPRTENISTSELTDEIKQRI